MKNCVCKIGKCDPYLIHNLKVIVDGVCVVWRGGGCVVVVTAKYNHVMNIC